MPHISIEYSANLETLTDIGGLCEALRAAAAAHPVFPLAGVRVRAYSARHYAIADGNPAHAFVDIHIRLREGRAPEDKADATQALFTVARTYLGPVMASHSLALSMEMRDITAEFAPKTGSIRDHLPDHLKD